MAKKKKQEVIEEPQEEVVEEPVEETPVEEPEKVTEVTEKGTIVTDAEAVGKPLDVEEFWRQHEQREHEKDAHMWNLGARRIQEIHEKWELFKRS